MEAGETMTIFDISAIPPASAMRNHQYLCGCWRTGGAGGYFHFLIVVTALRTPLPDLIVDQQDTLATRKPVTTRNRKSPVFMRIVTGLRVVTGFLEILPLLTTSRRCIRYIFCMRYKLALWIQRGNSRKAVTHNFWLCIEGVGFEHLCRIFCGKV
jgi:hypothetical protein